MKKEGKEKAPFAKAMAILIGTTVGAGIFGIPYVVAKAGFLIGLIHLLVLGAIVLLINLFTGEIALRTKKRHMLAGYAEKYLGKTGKTVMALTAIFGIFGALIAYLIGEGEVLSAIFGNNPMIFSIGFFVIASAIIWFDLRAVAGSELLLSGIMLAIIIIISALALPNVDLDNLKTFDIGKFFLPYGVVLFAFVGASAVPEMKGVLKQEKKMLRNAIVFGTIIPFVIYLIFTFVVVGITGIGTTEVATVGLGEALGKYMVFLGNIFAVFAMATSFIVLGLALKWMFHYDYGLPRGISWLITCFIPLIIFLAGARSFIGVIGLTGAVAGGVESILLILTAKMAKKKGERKPEYAVPLNWFIAIMLIALFMAGIVYQFLF